MCDQILVIANNIRVYESELHYLKKLLKTCQENKSKGYNCDLISEQISKKEKNMENFREMQIKHVELCTLYRNLEMEHDYFNKNK
jgi:hypothetical protein